MKAGGPFRPGPPPQRSPFGPPSPRPMGPPLNPAPFHLQAPPPPASRWRPRPRVGVAIELKPRPLLGRGSAPSRVRRRYGRVGGGGEGGGTEGGTNPPGHPHMGARIWEPPPKKSPSPSPSGCPRMLGGHSGGFMGSPGGGILCWGCGAPGVALWLWGGHPLIRCSFPPPPQVLSALLGARRPYSSVFRVRRSGGGLYWGPSYGVPQYRGPFGVFPSA